MTDTRKKLIELLGDKLILGRGVVYEVADHLIANGVTVLTEDEQRNIYTVQEIEALQNEAYDLGVDSVLHNRFGLSWADAEGLRKEVSRLQAATKWIPVTERLPKEFVTVLVYAPEEQPMQTVHEAYLANGCFSSRLWIFEAKEVTHWMPLPKPPKAYEV